MSLRQYNDELNSQTDQIFDMHKLYESGQTQDIYRFWKLPFFSKMVGWLCIIR